MIKNRLSVYRRLALGVLAIGAAMALPNRTLGAETPKPVFTKDIAPIFQEKCNDCHRKGSMAPMSLETYQDARPWAKAIKDRVATRQMPPWHIDKTVGIQHFANDRSLNDQQIATIVKWVDSGSPMGDAKDMPPPKKYDDDNGGWLLAKQFGQPDLVLESDPYTVPAHGQDAWFKPMTPVPVTEPRWVRAVEMRPASLAGRRVTHHALAYLIQDESGKGDGGGSGAASANAGLLMEWAIGKNYDIYRPNTGKLLVPGARISWEMHYHAVGEEIRDHVQLAVFLYPKGEVPKYRTRLHAIWALPAGNLIDIPPNSLAETSNYFVMPSAGRLENFQPHMHLRGKAMALEAVLPDGTTQMISYVDHFNFNWMNNYIYADDAAPVLPKGTIIHVTAWYDNTANNPNNPDPNQWVGFGDRTVDEMGHAWVNITYISDEDYKEWAAQHKPKRGMDRASQQ